ncbi:putative baseplate assembly protein [Puia dinghuensis]|uniref:Putative baseplate assembly protein n=1 Tax=Puia dinghuensis TaxID=1792502 RepID=A0A8J2U9J3_9BACT|nr:putative baseplate assembly protein [Puia dinghuensis]
MLNGIDFLEVMDNPGDPYDERQTKLFVYFLKPLTAGSLTVDNILITGGDRIQNIQVTAVTVAQSQVLSVQVAKAGDFSTYTLQIVQSVEHEQDAPPTGFDPILSSIDFCFKVACPSDFDCQPACDCAPGPQKAPAINYVAKDYASFRQLMLDRLSLLVPDWTERHAADLGIVLVEMLSYVGDYLSYKQDAIATEAYLHTARRRISVRRHVRLVDYFMHDGCNSRVWVQVRVGPGVVGFPLTRTFNGAVTQLLTQVSALPAGLSVFRPTDAFYQTALIAGSLVFEPMQDVQLYTDHNQLLFYTWGDSQCCLPQGAVTATLAGSHPYLQVGQVLILQEVLGPQTGAAADADPTHRYPVCLSSVTASSDPLYGVAVTEISWAAADALPAPLCISSLVGTHYYDNVSVALGNIVLADYGSTIQDTTTSSLAPSVVAQPDPALTIMTGSCADHCNTPVATPTPPRFNPLLSRGPLTQAAPFDATVALSSAAACMQWTVESAAPAITLTQTVAGEPGVFTWTPLRDLLGSAADTLSFVAEVESDGSTQIRFGNGLQGMRPVSGSRFMATYRIGNGASGNIGAGTIAYLVTSDTALLSSIPQTGMITNPLPAQGGVEPESMDTASQNAPDAFRTQERAVTAQDYADFAQTCNPGIQVAACTFRWTGSWRTAFLSVDPTPMVHVDDTFKQSLLNCMDRYRMAGQDLDVDASVYVSLEIHMTVCVAAGYFAANVKEALLAVFSNKILPDGTRGVFYPGNFGFGQTVYLSPLYAAAQQTAGVSSVKITRFRRQGDKYSNGIAAGKLEMHRLEIPRLDNDRNYPDRGIFKLTMNTV